MFEAVEGLVAEHAELERQLGAPETHADARLAKRLNQRYAELSSIIGAWRDWQQLGDDVDAARELAAEDPRLRATRPTRWPSAAVDRRGAAAPPAGAARPDRRQGRDPRGEVGGGRRGVGAVRRRPAPHVHPVRRARGWKIEILDATESDLGGYKSVTVAVKAKGTSEPGRGAVRPAEVRGRRAPGAAGAGDRVAGPGPHQRRRRPGAARGRAGRRRASTRTTCASTSSAAAARAGRASTPPTPRSGSPTCRPASWSAARTRRASCRTRSRRCGSCARGCWPRPRRRPTRRPARPAAARSAPSTAPSGSAPTTSRRTGSPTTAPATSPTTSTRCSTATCSRCSTPASTPTSTARLEALEHVTARRERAVRRDRRWLREAGVASPEHDAAELLAHVLGTDRGAAGPGRRRCPPRRVGDVRRAGRPPRRPRAAPAPDRDGVLPPRRAARRPGRVRAAARDRAARRLGDRARARERRAARSWSTCAPAPGRSPRRSPTRSRAPACTPSSSTRPRTPGPSATSTGTGVDLRRGDMADAPSTTWPARVDVVTCNPPYIPLEAWESVAPEARDHDPHARALVRRRRPGRDPACWSAGPPLLLRPGGVVGAEHADVQGESAPAVFAATGRWADVRDHRDLAGPSALRDRATGTMSPRSEAREQRALSPTATPTTSARLAVEAASLAIQQRRAGRAADRHRLRHRRRRVRPGRRRGAAGGQGPRPRDAAAGADQRGHHARRARDRRARLRPGAGRRVLARARSPWSAHQQSSLQWDLGDTRGTVAVRMPDHEVALELLERTGPLAVSSANLTGQPGRHRRRRRPRRCSASSVDVIVDAGEAPGQGGLHDRRRHRRRRAGCCAAARSSLERAERRARAARRRP